MEQNIIYEPLTMGDSEEFFYLAGNPKVAATMRFSCPHTKEESDKVLADYIAGGNRAFAIRSASGEALWGVFAFKAEPGSHTASLSQMLVPEMWGKGLGGRIIREMVALAKKEKWFRLLEGYVLETNTASRRMTEKCGFKETARHRFPGMKEDLVVYQMEIEA